MYKFSHICKIYRVICHASGHNFEFETYPGCSSDKTLLTPTQEAES